MPSLLRRVLVIGGAVLAPVAGASAQVDYSRADLIRVAQSRVLNVPDWVNLFGLGIPNWFADSTRFWYRVQTTRGAEFIVVDPARASRRTLFDNAKLAASLSVAADTAIDPAKLPFRTFKLIDDEQSVDIKLGNRHYACHLTSYRCVKGDTTSIGTPDWAVLSPDKKWEAFAHQANLYIRPAAGAKRDSIQLTTDGVAEFQYGVASPVMPPPVPDVMRRPEVHWSPDSKQIIVPQIDERGVRKYPVYSSTDIHPKLFLYPVGTPGDSIVPRREYHIITVATKTNIKVDAPVQVNSSFGLTGDDAVQWSSRGDRFFFIHAGRANKAARVLAGDPETGKSREVIRDSLATFVEDASGVFTGNWRAVGDGRELLWWSERDGWGHLYRYDADGKVINQVTSGPWLVDRVKHVDAALKQVYFQALGRDSANPYFSHLLRVNFDGTGLVDLTPEVGNHAIAFVPTGKYFIDVYSQPTVPPVTSLRSAVDGRKLLTLEEADITPLRQAGWTPPTPVRVKARDGVTDLYGLLFLPSRVDSTKKYPIICHVYPGPQVGTIVQWSFNAGGEPRALAELGFAVLEVNALGTPGRSKAFHDAYYGNMGDNGLPDQIAAMQQIAARYAFIDLDRAGIYGHSGGGFASTDAILRYPDFFKVAVSGSGNHDNRSYIYDWGEKYQGPFRRDSLTKKDNYDSQANYLMAGNLKGHLLLMTGDMDTNVHPTMTLRMVDALIKAGKDFDMLVIPDASHGLPDYSIKRRWDYFVRWLAGGEPPRDYHMMSDR